MRKLLRKCHNRSRNHKPDLKDFWTFFGVSKVDFGHFPRPPGDQKPIKSDPKKILQNLFNIDVFRTVSVPRSPVAPRHPWKKLLGLFCVNIWTENWHGLVDRETYRKVFVGIPTLLKRTGNTVSIRSDVWKHEFHKSIWKVGADRAVLNELAL